MKIDTVEVFTFPVHSAAGRLANADALPVASVFEDDGDASMDTPTVEQIGAITGWYRVIVDADSALYTVGKTYNIHVDLAVGGVDMGARVAQFLLEANNIDDVATAVATVDGKADVIQAKTDKLTFNVSDQVAADVKAMDDGVIVASKIGLGAITADKIAASALDGKGDWSTSAEVTGIDTKIGTPVALDGGVATMSAMLVKMADDNGGADFDATTDSLHESAGGGGGGPTKEEIRLEMDANSTRLAAIDQNTSDPVAVVLAP